MSEVSYEMVKTHDVIGVNVTNETDENLGKIEEIVLNKSTGEVHYAVLSFGGIMGMGDKLFALPWKSLKYNSTKNKFTVNQTKEHLAQAPGFDKAHWPNMADNSWQSGISKFYDTY